MSGREISQHTASTLTAVETVCESVGDEFEVKAKCVVNATGPYTDFVRRLDSPKCRRICQPSSGVHVVLPQYYRSVLNVLKITWSNISDYVTKLAQ